MRTLRHVVLVSLFAASVATLGACRQGAGERCSIQADCQEGLLCILPQGATPQSGGTCVPAPGQDAGTDEDASTPDLATPPDLSGTD